MNLENSYKLVKSSISNISNIEMIPTTNDTANIFQCQVNIDYQEKSRQSILNCLPTNQTTHWSIDPTILIKETCPICLDKFTTKSHIMHGRRCQHLFHKTCLDNWLKDESRKCLCPICQQAL